MPMPDDKRGKAHTEYLATQLRDFTGMCWGNITPTDIDCFTDFGGLLFVYVDAKLPGVEMERGQEWAFERAVDDCKHAAICIIGEHANREGAIDFANLAAVKYYWRGRKKRGEWKPFPRVLTVKQAIDVVLRHLKLYRYLNQDQL